MAAKTFNVETIKANIQKAIEKELKDAREALDAARANREALDMEIATLEDVIAKATGEEAPKKKGPKAKKGGNAFPSASLDDVIAVIKAQKGEPIVGRKITEILEAKSKSMPSGYGKKLAENKSIKISGKAPWQAFAWKD